MKSYLVILAMLCFGNSAAQTTKTLSVSTLNDTTVKISRVVIVTSTTSVKTVILGKGVSEWDATEYYVNKKKVVDRVRLLSLFHGSVQRQKILYEKGNKLLYYIQEVPDNWYPELFCFFIIGCFALVQLATSEKAFPILWVPTCVGILSALFIDACAHKYQYTWDESISMAIVGLLVGVFAISIRLIITKARTYRLKRLKQLQTIH